ncbi:MAG: hypothetical protein ACR2QW_07525 [bacterium]
MKLQQFPIGNPVLPQFEDDRNFRLSSIRGSVETLHHPPAARVVGYGEEKVQTPNSRPFGDFGAAKAVVGMNQPVGGSSPSAGSTMCLTMAG